MPGDWMQRFLEKFRELLKIKAADGDLSEDDLSAAMRQARAHVGGMARGEKQRAEREAAQFAEQGHAGLMVGYWLPREVASHLAIKGGEVPDDLHLTLCYCGDVSMLGELAIAKALVNIESLCRMTTPMTGTISGVGRFNGSPTSDGKDVLYASVDMPGLPSFREALAETMAYAGCPVRQDHGYTPHVTLRYLDPTEPTPEIETESLRFRMDRIVFVAGDKRLEIPLTGTSDMVNPRRFSESKGFPYSSLDVLPDAVKSALPPDAQRVWMAAANSSFNADPEDEGKAARIAWGAVKRAGWKRDDAGNWKKASEIDTEAAIRATEASMVATFRLLGEVALSEDGKTGQVQIFPALGKYSHPRYGELEISKPFLERVKANFDSQIYQQELPLTIDLEHQSSLSGAAGWIKDVELHGDKGMWATIEFNDRGRSLVAADSYRYFSPEFYDKWQDPATSKNYEDVLIGGALTNRPFFKGMAPVVMASEGVFCFAEMAEGDMDMAGMMRDMMAQMQTMMKRMEKGEMPEDSEMEHMSELMGKMRKGMPDKVPEDGHQHSEADATGAGRSGSAASTDHVDQALDSAGGNAMGLTEEEARQFTEMRDSLKSLSERLATETEARKAAETEAKAARESVAVLERDRKRGELRQFVEAHRLAFQTEPDKAVDRLETLSIRLSAEEFEDYLGERRALHAQLKDSKIFEQVGGTRAAGGNGIESEVDAAVAKVMTERRIDRAEAIGIVMSEQPALYKRYDDAQRARVRRGGE